MHSCRIDMLDEILIASLATLRSYSPTMLCTELRQRSTLDISQMRNCNHHFIVGVEVFRIELFGSIYDFRTTLVTVFLLHFNKLILDNLLAELLIRQNFFEISNLLHQLFVFGMQLILQKSSKLTKTHFYDGTSLNFRQLEAIHQISNCLIRSLCRTYDTDNFINIIGSNDQSFQDMSTLLCLTQIILCTTNNYLVTMFNKQTNQVFQVQQLRSSMYQSNIVHPERSLQSRHLEQLIQYDACIGITFHIDHDTHTLTVRLIVYIRNTFYLLFVHQSSDTFNQLLLVYVIRNLVYDNLVMSRMRFDFRLGTHNHTSTSGLISIAHPADTINISSGREIGSLDVVHQAVYINIIIINVSNTCIYHLRQIMSRHVGSHTHGNTRSTINQKVRNTCRHDSRFLQCIIEVVREVNSFLIEVLHHILADLFQACFSITHGSRAITVNRTKVSLSVDQRIAHCPILCHTN